MVGIKIKITIIDNTEKKFILFIFLLIYIVLENFNKEKKLFENL